MNDQHSSYRKLPHVGNNNVSTSASTRAERSLKGTAQPPQAALRVFMLKTSSAASDSKADPTMTTPLQWITMMPNIQCENTTEYTEHWKICHMYISAVYKVLETYMLF